MSELNLRPENKIHMLKYILGMNINIPISDTFVDLEYLKKDSMNRCYLYSYKISTVSLRFEEFMLTPFISLSNNQCACISTYVIEDKHTSAENSVFYERHRHAAGHFVPNVLNRPICLKNKLFFLPCN